jgi:hypothetical protein
MTDADKQAFTLCIEVFRSRNVIHRVVVEVQRRYWGDPPLTSAGKYD